MNHIDNSFTQVAFVFPIISHIYSTSIYIYFHSNSNIYIYTSEHMREMKWTWIASAECDRCQAFGFSIPKFHSIPKSTLFPQAIIYPVSHPQYISTYQHIQNTYMSLRNFILKSTRHSEYSSISSDFENF